MTRLNRKRKYLDQVPQCGVHVPFTPLFLISESLNTRIAL